MRRMSWCSLDVYDCIVCVFMLYLLSPHELLAVAWKSIE